MTKEILENDLNTALRELEIANAENDIESVNFWEREIRDIEQEIARIEQEQP